MGNTSGKGATNDIINKRLPNEIIFKIFDYLSVQDLKNCFTTCQRWRDILSDYLRLKRIQTILIAGGEIDGDTYCGTPFEDSDIIEGIGIDFYVPNLSISISKNSLVLSNDGELISCGGGQTNDYKQCHVLDKKKWVPHSVLTNPRRLATAIVMPNGIYIFGGIESPTTSDFLPNGAKTWEPGPSVPDHGIQLGSGVKISDKVQCCQLCLKILKSFFKKRLLGFTEVIHIRVGNTDE